MKTNAQISGIAVAPQNAKNANVKQQIRDILDREMLEVDIERRKAVDLAVQQEHQPSSVMAPK